MFPLMATKKGADHSNSISTMTPENPINGIKGSCQEQIVS